jgi:hypothetical protein
MLDSSNGFKHAEEWKARGQEFYMIGIMFDLMSEARERATKLNRRRFFASGRKAKLDARLGEIEAAEVTIYQSASEVELWIARGRDPEEKVLLDKRVAKLAGEMLAFDII